MLHRHARMVERRPRPTALHARPRGLAALASGRITLRDDRLITTDLDGAKIETAVGNDWRRLLAEDFGIV